MSDTDDFPRPSSFLIPSALVVVIFGAGIAATLFTTPMPSKEPVEPTPVELPNPLVTNEITYIQLRNAITSTIPGLRGTVQIETALMMQPGISKKVAEIAEQNPSAMVAVMSEAVERAQIGVSDLNQLQQKLPPLFKEALNNYLGNESIPEPVQEVLITRLNMSQ